ncbi:MAG: cytochrome c peroxidase, partial [Flavobacteriales bacterium]
MKRATSFMLWAVAVGWSFSGCDCGKDPQVWNPTPYELPIPPFFPPMDIPADNPLTVEGVELGRMLFWETRLSEDQTMSCGSCHLPE